MNTNIRYDAFFVLIRYVFEVKLLSPNGREIEYGTTIRFPYTFGNRFFGIELIFECCGLEILL
jgi:hypothetical protein